MCDKYVACNEYQYRQGMSVVIEVGCIIPQSLAECEISADGPCYCFLKPIGGLLPNLEYIQR